MTGWNRARSGIARALACVLLFLGAGTVPAHAQVTITFWSQELGVNFPHAFFTLRGVPAAGGAPVDLSFGFTPKTVSPAMLLATVPGKVVPSSPADMRSSNAHFSRVLTDDQYRAVMQLAVDWSDRGDNRYRVNTRNCVHFVAEAMRRSGLRVEEPRNLMKRPRSFAQLIARLNAGQVRVIEQEGRAYLATLRPIGAGASQAR